MKKVINFIGWMLLLLLVLSVGIAIAVIGWMYLKGWWFELLESVNFFIFLKSILLCIVFACMYLVGMGFIMADIIFGGFVFKEYILPKKKELKDEQQSETDKDGYTEV